MKAFALLLLLVMTPFLAAGAPVKDKDVVVKTDKFTGKTTVIMKPFGITPFLGYRDASQASTIGVQLRLAAFANAEDGGDVSLIVYISAAHWQFLNGTDVHVLADGQPIDLGKFVATTGHVEADGVVMTQEAIVGRVDRATLNRLARSSTLELEVGLYQCKVNAKNIKRLKDFGDTLVAVVASK